MYNNIERQVCSMNKKSVILVIIGVIALLVAVLVLFNNQTPEINRNYITAFAEEEAEVVEIKFGNLKRENYIGDEFKTLHVNLISATHTAVIAEFKGEDKIDVDYYKFSNLQVIYGSAPEKDIFAIKDFTVTADLNEGEKYILFLNRYDTAFRPISYYTIENVFRYYENNEIDETYSFRYSFNSDEVGESTANVWFENVSGGNNICGIIKCAAEKYGFDLYETAPEDKVFRGETLNKLIDECDYIMKVNVLREGSMFFEENYQSYRCTVDEVYKDKGNVEDEIYLHAALGKLTSGKSYIVFAYKEKGLHTENTYDVCADNGIISLDDNDLVEEFYKYYNK